MAGKSDEIRIQFGEPGVGLAYRVRVREDKHRGGYEALLLTDDGDVLIMPNGRSPSHALAQLVEQLSAGDSYDRKIAKEITRHTGAKAQAGKTRSHATKQDFKYDDSEIERMFKKSGSKGTIGDHDKTVIAILGDPMYVKRFKMPKWNIKPTVLTSHDVAIRHWNELGIPRSKDAHAQRADHFRDLRNRFEAEHQRLLNEGAQTYGKNGPLIAGGFREDWPSALKDRIRFVSSGTSILSDATRLHEALSKSRSPVFQ